MSFYKLEVTKKACSFLIIACRLFLETGTIFNSFYSLQHMSFSKQDLNIIWGGLVIDSPLILIMQLLLATLPWALIEPKFWIIFKISFLAKFTDEIKFSACSENHKWSYWNFLFCSAKKELSIFTFS